MKCVNDMTCIVCPLGCQMKVCQNEEGGVTVTGNKCKRGEKYGYDECTNPLRMLTTTIRVDNGGVPLVSVKSRNSLPKGLVFDCIKKLKKMEVSAPIEVGDVVIEDILGTGVDIVATRSIERK